MHDVVVVGGGNAACSAAHAALEKTSSVAIIEKSTLRDRGGNSAMTGHIRFVFNGVEDLRPLVRGMSDGELLKLLDCGLPHRTEAEVWDEIMRVTNNQSDQELLQVHVTESLNTVQWLAGKGHERSIIWNGVKHPWDEAAEAQRALRLAGYRHREA